MQNNKKPVRNGTTRLRATIYGERRIIALKMGHDLNTRLMAFCNSIHTPANTYINQLIEASLTTSAPAPVKRIKIGPSPLNVSIRLEPDLHHRLMAYCARSSVSANSFICGLIRQDLALRNL